MHTSYTFLINYKKLFLGLANDANVKQHVCSTDDSSKNFYLVNGLQSKNYVFGKYPKMFSMLKALISRAVE